MALDPSSANFTAQEESLAGALIQHDSNESAHWADSARSVVVGLAEYEVMSAREQGRMPSLANVRGYLSMGEEDFGTSVGAMLAGARSDGVRDRMAAFEKMTNELRAVRSTAKAQTTWLADPAMRKAVERHDFDFADLKSKPMTVYVILPSHLISKGMTYSRYLRLILQSALEAMTTTPRRSERPVWFLVDETYSLGPMPILERMMSEGAGYGIQLQPIIQNLGQLKELYRSNYETFIANAAVQQWFAPRDMTTAEYVSKMLGQYTANTQTIGARNEISIGETGRPLLRPEEVMQMTEYEQIVFLRGCPNPLKLYRSPYFKKTWGLEGKYDPNPYHIG
jgi:type IV secretion system protein VirD4